MIVNLVSQDILCDKLHLLLRLKLFNGFQLFRDAIKAAVSYKRNSTDFMDEVMRELEVCYHSY